MVEAMSFYVHVLTATRIQLCLVLYEKFKVKFGWYVSNMIISVNEPEVRLCQFLENNSA